MERVEAKLDALGEELHGMRRPLLALTDRVLQQGQETAAHGRRLDDLGNELRNLRDEMRDELRGLRDELQTGFQRAREDLELRLAKLRVDVGAARIDAIEEQLADLRRRLEPSPGK
jgi:chromosome segregation ATPase